LRARYQPIPIAQSLQMGNAMIFGNGEIFAKIGLMTTIGKSEYIARI
jgi:hypothetical protein